ncbi:DUF167 domain-containing protein [Thermocrinis sp.]|jgi:hypothetical protein|uniref:DUF167 domain-containing protein n=1 Tax=Thermocrinis sp. TaxID=2024383 RepID=UPI00262BFD2E|nr:DUF167 domain-containing protein [Thermocrinis sp.]
MLIKVKAKPRSKEEYVKKLGEDFYEVAVKEAPEKGRANARIVELLSIYLGVKKDRIKLVAGETSKLKLFQILGEEDQP